MGLYDIIDEITERQVTKTETGDNRIWGVMVGIVAKNFDPNSTASGGANSGAEAMDGRVCVTIPVNYSVDMTKGDPAIACSGECCGC